MSAKPSVTRKRNRKRKRRVASSSEDSSSGSDSDSSSDAGPSTSAAKSVPVISAGDKLADDESSSSSSDDSTDSEADAPNARRPSQVTTTGKDTRMKSPSPEQPLAGSIPIPPFLPSTGNIDEDARKEQELKDKFRKFWMTTIVDAFADDLDELRKEPNMNPSRLALLIDSLASGAEVFSPSARGTNDVNEMEVVLEGVQ
ncbi:hypothetical protein EUX98_g3750 [Antrodiella citrinella]|uniref:Ribosome assembly protein 3 n=1 Tax=Antrodiella citrinella TaxID=2447956 RepID=A0A4S4MVR5_9APHY|nr:hypothetical protein EUX98_g3750 [Antrodiella citrinella]